MTSSKKKKKKWLHQWLSSRDNPIRNEDSLDLSRPKISIVLFEAEKFWPPWKFNILYPSEIIPKSSSKVMNLNHKLCWLIFRRTVKETLHKYGSFTMRLHVNFKIRWTDSIYIIPLKIPATRGSRQWLCTAVSEEI